jgi:hypothetical protein
MACRTVAREASEGWCAIQDKNPNFYVIEINV